MGTKSLGLTLDLKPVKTKSRVSLSKASQLSPSQSPSQTQSKATPKKQKSVNSPSAEVSLNPPKKQRVDQGEKQIEKLLTEGDKETSGHNHIMMVAKQRHYLGMCNVNPLLLSPPYVGTEDRDVDIKHVWEIAEEMITKNQYATPIPMSICIVAKHSISEEFSEMWERNKNNSQELSKAINDFLELNPGIGKVNLIGTVITFLSLYSRRRTRSPGSL